MLRATLEHTQTGRLVTPRSTELSHRSDSQELPPISGGLVTSHDLLNAESDGAAWRLIEAFSERGLPFELALRWSGGSGTGASGKLTIANASRVCIFARSLTLSAANLANTPNRVGVTVADGFAPTANVWEYRASCDGHTPIQLPVPPFALSFQVHLAKRGTLPRSVISLFDGTGALSSQYSGAAQAASGIPVGGAARIEVLTPSPTALRGVFRLSI